MAGVSALAVALASVVLSGRIESLSPAASPATTSCVPTRSAPGPLVDLGIRPADVGGILTQDTVGRLVDLADRAGASIISTTASWRTLRPDPAEPYDWRSLDSIIDAAGAAGKRVRLQLVGMPTWAVTGSAPDSSWRPPLTDQEVAAWSAFVSDVMLHVRGRVDYVEIWDAPNEASRWASGPDPRAFSALLQASYPVVKRIDPDVVVVSGGLGNNDLGYLKALYRALDDSPGERRPFDMLGLHPTAGETPADAADPDGTFSRAPFGEYDETFGGFRRVHELMRDHGDGAKDIYIGELGYATPAGPVEPPVDDANRARYLTGTMEATTCTPYVFVVSWQLHATAAAPQAWTMLDPELRPTQTYDALVAWSQRVEAVTKG